MYKILNYSEMPKNMLERLVRFNGDPRCLRPWRGGNGKTYITLGTKEKPENIQLNSVSATLPYDSWKEIDDLIVPAARPRLKLVGHIRGAGLTYNLNNIGKITLTTQTKGDISDAEMSMDGLRRSNRDRAPYEYTTLPLPITYKDLGFSAREILASQVGGERLDTSNVVLAAEKVAEEVEKIACGSRSEYSFGGGTIQGLRNFGQRIQIVITSPEDSAWTPELHVTEVLAMKQALQDAHYYGPYSLCYDNTWDQYLDRDFKALGDITLRARLKMIDGIDDIITLDYLQDFDVCMFQKTASVVRMIIGMDIMTIQWDEEGGLASNIKVMTIQVPQFRADQNGTSGLAHGAPL